MEFEDDVIPADVARILFRRRLLGRTSNDRYILSFSALYPGAKGTMIVPLCVDSVEGYEYLYFNKQTARLLLDSYLRPLADAEAPGFLGLALDHILNPGLRNKLSNENDWAEFMNVVGISANIQKGVLSPKHDELRASMSCQDWLRVRIETAFIRLMTLGDLLRVHISEQDRQAALVGGGYGAYDAIQSNPKIADDSYEVITADFFEEYMAEV